MRQHGQRGRFWPTIVDRDSHENIVGVGFGIFDGHIAVAIIGKNACVDQLELRIVESTLMVLVDELLIGEGRLRVFVEKSCVRTCRRRVEIVIKLFDIFAVIALPVGQAE